MNMTQIQGFTKSQIENLSSAQVKNILPVVLAYFTISQLGNFSAAAITNFTAYQLESLYLTYQRDFLMLYNASYLNNFPYSVILSFKRLFDVKITPIISNENDTLLKNLSTTNWLIIAATNNNVIRYIFSTGNFSGISHLAAEAVMGIRGPGQVVGLDPKVFGHISSKQAFYLFPDALENMTIPQYQALSPEAIGGLNPMFIPSVPIGSFSSLFCPQIINFTMDQKNAMTEDQHTEYHKMDVHCTFGFLDRNNLLIAFGIAAAASIAVSILAIMIVYKKPDYVAV
jgi:hypothetical protein